MLHVYTKSKFCRAIEVKDTKHDIFEALLFFIYSDQIKFEEDEYENIFGNMLTLACF